MPILTLKDVDLNYQEDGDPTGAPVVFTNSLGTDLRLWDKVVARMPAGVRLIRFDKRGHGQSSCPKGPYSMGALIRDTEQMLDHLNVRDCVFVGLSIGGMIAQGLAVKRMDQIRGLVLSNTAAKIGTSDMWNRHIEHVQTGGLESVADDIVTRWFGPDFHATPEVADWRRMLVETPTEGYTGCCAAIAGTDFISPTSGLGLPTLGIAGSEDGATPTDMVRETIDLIRGSKFHLIRRAGHLPCVESPDTYTGVLVKFLKEIGHI